MSTANTPHIVVVGGGFAGMSVLKALRKTRAKITLVDRHAYSTFQPLLYQVATATLNPGDITYFLRSVRSRRPQVRFVNGTV
ncbi:MAG TPA: FAD-dependent oxidoreductase, partial [Ruania sp.]|nr:FAD-dependent oxidoreductase [Ruania sp.]